MQATHHAAAGVASIGHCTVQAANLVAAAHKGAGEASPTSHLLQGSDAKTDSSAGAPHFARPANAWKLDDGLDRSRRWEGALTGGLVMREIAEDTCNALEGVDCTAAIQVGPGDQSKGRAIPEIVEYDCSAASEQARASGEVGSGCVLLHVLSASSYRSRSSDRGPPSRGSRSSSSWQVERPSAPLTLNQLTSKLKREAAAVQDTLFVPGEVHASAGCKQAPTNLVDLHAQLQEQLQQVQHTCDCTRKQLRTSYQQTAERLDHLTAHLGTPVRFSSRWQHAVAQEQMGKPE